MGGRCKHHRLQVASHRAGGSCLPHTLWAIADHTNDSYHLPAVNSCFCVCVSRQCGVLIMRHTHHPLPNKVGLRPTDHRERGKHPPRRDCRPNDGIAREHNQQQQHHPTCAHMTPLGDAQAGHTGGACRHISYDASYLALLAALNGSAAKRIKRPSLPHYQWHRDCALAPGLDSMLQTEPDESMFCCCESAVPHLLRKQCPCWGRRQPSAGRLQTSGACCQRRPGRR